MFNFDHQAGQNYIMYKNIKNSKLSQMIKIKNSNIKTLTYERYTICRIYYQYIVLLNSRFLYKCIIIKIVLYEVNLSPFFMNLWSNSVLVNIVNLLHSLNP